MQKIKLLLLLVGIYSVLNADVTIHPFGTHATYKDGFKRSDTSLGVYLDNRYEKQLFKVGYEYKDTTYTNSTYDNYQNDLIVGCSSPLSKHLLLDLAAHFTFSDLDQANHNQIYLGGISYVKKEHFSLGIDIAYSKYNDKSLAKKVLQLSPHFGFWYGDILSRLGRVFVKFNYNYINPGQENVSLQHRYNSAEFSIRQYTKNFNNIFAYSFGKGLNLVKDKGFTVFNNNEIHTRGFILSSAYKINRTSLIKLSYIYERYDAYDPVLSASKSDVESRRLLLSGSLKF